MDLSGRNRNMRRGNVFYEPSWDLSETPLPDPDLAYWMHHVHSPAPPSPLGRDMPQAAKNPNSSPRSSPVPPLYTPDALRNFWPTPLRAPSPGQQTEEFEDEIDGRALQARLPWLYVDQRADPYHWSKVHFSRTYYRNLLPTMASVNMGDSDWETEDSEDELTLGLWDGVRSRGGSGKRVASAVKRARVKERTQTKRKRSAVSVITQAEVDDLVFV